MTQTEVSLFAYRYDRLSHLIFQRWFALSESSLRCHIIALCSLSLLSCKWFIMSMYEKLITKRYKFFNWCLRVWTVHIQIIRWKSHKCLDRFECPPLSNALFLLLPCGFFLSTTKALFKALNFSSDKRLVLPSRPSGSPILAFARSLESKLGLSEKEGECQIVSFDSLFSVQWTCEERNQFLI